MHTDYIGGEERCRFIARKLIYWIAAVTVTGGAADATGVMDVVRARAMTAPFLSRSAAVPATAMPCHPWRACSMKTDGAPRDARGTT